MVAGTVGFLSVLTQTAGVAGGFISRWLFLLFGRGAYAVPAIPLLWGLAMTASGKSVKLTWRLFGVSLALYLALMCLHLATPPGLEFDEVYMRLGGGAFGAAGAWLLAVAFGPAGRLVVMGGLAVLAILSITKLSPGRALGLLVVVGLRIGLEAIAGRFETFSPRSGCARRQGRRPENARRSARRRTAGCCGSSVRPAPRRPPVKSTCRLRTATQ